MSEFVAITTQEQLDAVIGDRLKRSEEKWAKKYEGYISPDDFNAKTSELQKQLSESTSAFDAISKKAAGYEKEIAERDSKIKGFEVSAMKHRIAHENGLSFDAVDFLQGSDEESIKASADKFKSLMGKSHSAPEFKNEPDVSNNTDASVRKLVKNLANK